METLHTGSEVGHELWLLVNPEVDQTGGSSRNQEALIAEEEVAAAVVAGNRVAGVQLSVQMTWTKISTHIWLQIRFICVHNLHSDSSGRVPCR